MGNKTTEITEYRCAKCAAWSTERGAIEEHRCEDFNREVVYLNVDDGDGQLDEYRRLLGDLGRLKKEAAAAKLYVGYTLSCRLKNQHEWMVGLVDAINRYAEIIGDRDRFEFDGDGIVRHRD